MFTSSAPRKWFTPRCQRSAFVDRDEYQEQKILVCPLPGCNHSWCKACQQKIDFSGPQHSCDGSLELTHLMKQKGWKHCPGQPESGLYMLIISNRILL